ncbi:MAG: LysE family transporter [Bacillota bacterium]
MDLASIFISALVVGLSGAMMPGPLLTVTIKESARRGFIAGPLIVVGHGLLEFLLVIGLIYGLSDILKYPGVSISLAVFGGVVLAWMGYGVLTSALRGEVNLNWQGQETKNIAPSPIERLGPVLEGALISLSNPYWVLWWAAIGAAFVIQSLQRGWAGLLFFYSGHVLADLVWYSLVAVVVATGKRFLSERIYQGILSVCGAFLIALAAYFIYSGFSGKLGIGGS